MNLGSEETNTDEQVTNILRLIKRIKKDRNRPCYQNILSFANREENKMEMDELKDIIDKMVGENIITDIGVNGKESFSIIGEINISSELASSGTQTPFEKDDENDITNLENFINTSFFDTVKNVIKGEVQNALKLKSSTRNSELNNESPHNNDELCLVLKEQITFLQKELMAKDTIIKMLINDRNGGYNIKDCDASINQNAHTFNNASCNVRKRSVANITSDKKLSDENVDKVTNSNRNSSRTQTNSNFNIDTSNQYDVLAENTNGDASIQDDENIESENDRENKTKKKRSITILGDSIVKDIRSHEMRRCTKQGEKIYVKTFPGATTECMKDYVKPTMKYNPDFVILHTGTNDLKSNKSSEEISDDIIKLALDIKTDQNDIVVSGILARNDDMKKVRGK